MLEICKKFSMKIFNEWWRSGEKFLEENSTNSYKKIFIFNEFYFNCHEAWIRIHRGSALHVLPNGEQREWIEWPDGLLLLSDNLKKGLISLIFFNYAIVWVMKMDELMNWWIILRYPQSLLKARWIIPALSGSYSFIINIDITDLFLSPFLSNSLVVMATLL